MRDCDPCAPSPPKSSHEAATRLMGCSLLDVAAAFVDAHLIVHHSKYFDPLQARERRCLWHHVQHCGTEGVVLACRRGIGRVLQNWESEGIIRPMTPAREKQTPPVPPPIALLPCDCYCSSRETYDRNGSILQCATERWQQCERN